MANVQQTNLYPGLTPVRLVATTDQVGLYYNGILNNGVGATFTYTATGDQVIDFVTIALNDSILFVGQNSANQNGIYICTQTPTSAGNINASVILQRRGDFQCIEQIKIGQYVSVGAGLTTKGSMYSLVEELPAHFGIDDLNFVSTPSDVENKYQQVFVSSAEFKAMYATPKLLIPAPGEGLMLTLKNAFISMQYGAVTYTGGGVVNIQYDDLINGTGYWTTTDTPADAFEQEESIILNMHVSFPTATDFTWTTAQIGNQGLYLSNQTAAFATGDGDFLVHLWYSIVLT